MNTANGPTTAATQGAVIPGRLAPVRGDRRSPPRTAGTHPKTLDWRRGEPNVYALPRRIRLEAYGARLESGLGSRPHGFKSRILRHSRKGRRLRLSSESRRRFASRRGTSWRYVGLRSSRRHGQVWISRREHLAHPSFLANDLHHEVGTQTSHAQNHQAGDNPENHVTGHAVAERIDISGLWEVLHRQGASHRSVSLHSRMHRWKAGRGEGANIGAA